MRSKIIKQATDTASKVNVAYGYTFVLEQEKIKTEIT